MCCLSVFILQVSAQLHTTYKSPFLEKPLSKVLARSSFGSAKVGVLNGFSTQAAYQSVF